MPRDAPAADDGEAAEVSAIKPKPRTKSTAKEVTRRSQEKDPAPKPAPGSAKLSSCFGPPAAVWQTDHIRAGPNETPGIEVLRPKAPTKVGTPYLEQDSPSKETPGIRIMSPFVPARVRNACEE